MLPEPVATLAELVDRRVRDLGDAPAVLAPDARLSYADLATRSAACARRLHALGVGNGTRVGLLLPQSAAWVVTFLGLARLGALAVLLNDLATSAELEGLARATGVEVLVVPTRPDQGTDPLTRTFPALAEVPCCDVRVASLPRLRSVVRWDEGAVTEAPSSSLEAVTAEPEAPAVVISTSGSTGVPKCVVHAQRALVGQGESLAAAMERTADDRVLVAMPFFWVGGLVVGLVATLAAGATVVVQERIDPEAALDLVEAEHVTHLVGWSTVQRRMMSAAASRTADLSSLARPLGSVFDGGRARMEGLGMTETLGPHSYLGISADTLSRDREGSVGWPVGGFERRIVDPATGLPCDPGEVGEICVRGPHLMLGLLADDLDPSVDADGWFHTRDQGYLSPEGELFFTGRGSDVVKVRGMNVSPAEVEQVLEAHPAVAHAVVFAAGDDALVASVVLDGGDDDLDSVTLRAWVRERLSAYKVPGHLHVSAEPAPLLVNGKLDRAALVALARATATPR